MILKKAAKARFLLLAMLEISNGFLIRLSESDISFWNWWKPNVEIQEEILDCDSLGEQKHEMS